MRRTFAVLLSLFCIALPLAAAAADAPPSMDRRLWRADLDTLYAAMQSIHPALHRRTTTAAMDAAVADLRRDVNRESWPRYVMGLYRLMALTGDGHTNFYPMPDAGPGFDTRYPFLTEVFADGAYVTAADPKYAAAVGGRIVAIDGKPMAELFRTFGSYWAHENDMWPLRWLPFALRRPGYLAGMGIAPDDVALPLSVTIEKEGARRDISIAPIPVAEDDAAQDGTWIHARDDAHAAKPLIDPGVPFDFVYLRERRAVYATYNQSADGDKETVAAFAERLFRFVDANNPDKLILDLRANGGGDNTLNQPLLLGLIRARAVDRPGHLFVLIGRHTFSAAQNFATQCERWTQALFVGEPTGSAPNLWGDAKQFELPNTHLHPMVSTLYWQDSDPRDQRPWILPDIAAGQTFADWRAGRDPALEAALDYQADPAVTPAPPIYRWQRKSQQGTWTLPF